jgi:hypothetical protein
LFELYLYAKGTVKMKTIIYLMIFPIMSLFAQIGQWEIKEEGMDYPVSGASAVVWEGMIYISGGYSDDLFSNVNWVQKFNPLEFNWTANSGMIWPRRGHSTVIKNNNIYCYGGIHDTSQSNTSIEAWYADNSSPGWVYDYNKTFDRIYSSGLVIGDNYYIIGGNPYEGLDSNEISYIAEYNIQLKTIAFGIADTGTTSDFPEQQMAANIGNDIYIFGGVMNGVTDEIFRYNISDHSLNLLPVSLLEPRAGAIAINGFNENEIYIIGGFNEQQNAMSSMEIFSADGQNYYINEGPELKSARSQLTGAKINDKIFVFGGKDNNGNVLSSFEYLNDPAVTAQKDNYVLNKFTLNQNYPNPFNPTTSINYELSEESAVKLKVYSLIGEELATLVNERKKAGNYTVEFDASSINRQISSGVYFYELSANENTSIKKMILLK